MNYIKSLLLGELILPIILFVFISQFTFAQSKNEPVKIAVIGLTHTHVHWILGRPDKGDIEIIAIVEPNRELARRYATHHKYSMDMVYHSSEEMLNHHRPEAVTAFGSIYEHLEVVKTFAPLGIHIMVEKPLAVSLKHARKMNELAKKHKVHLLTNYETSWYASNHKAYELVNEGRVGELRKIVVHDGHQGPVEMCVGQSNYGNFNGLTFFLGKSEL